MNKKPFDFLRRAIEPVGKKISMLLTQASGFASTVFGYVGRYGWLGIPAVPTRPLTTTWPPQDYPYSPYHSLRNDAVWACVRILSWSESSLPLNVFQRMPNGSNRYAIEHPLYPLLHSAPNSQMTTQQWRQTSMMHLMLYGNAFTRVLRLAGRITGLIPLRPTSMEIYWAPDLVTYIYRYWDQHGQWTDLAPGDLLHFRLNSLDGMIGLSPIAFHRMTLERGFAADQMALSAYVNAPNPAGILTHPGALKEPERANIRDSWQKIYSGPQNAGKVILLEESMKYEQLHMGMSMEDADYVNNKKLTVEEICRIFGVPPHLVQHLEKPTYASVEQQNLEYLTYTLQPIVTSMEQSMNQTFFTEPFETPYYCKHNMGAMLRSDLRSRYAAYQTGRMGGWLSVNEIRELEEMDPIEGGDVYLQPLNMATVGSSTADSLIAPPALPADAGGFTP